MRRVISLFFVIFCFFGVLVAVGHLVDFRPPVGMVFPPGTEWFSAHLYNYQAHPYLTYFHLLPAICFMFIAPFQFSTEFRNRHISWHRTSGLVFIGSTLVAAITGLFLGMKIPFGGIPESVIAALAFLAVNFFVFHAWRSIKARSVKLHREWMIRTFAVGAGVVSMRLIDIAFYPFHWVSDRTLFWATLYAGFVANCLVAEFWIRHTRKSEWGTR